MCFRIELPAEITARELSQKVLQVIQLLNMYPAELARILSLHCADIADLSDGRTCLKPGSAQWTQARRFIQLYNRLYDRFAGDGVAMYHWMRSYNSELDGIPHLLLVDQNRLARVSAALKRLNQKNT